jgi:hypothetical protein
MLKGYKTYIAAALSVITAGAGYLTGDLTAAAALQIAITAILSSTLRSGVADAVAAVKK